jgi:hypothetical protein
MATALANPKHSHTKITTPITSHALPQISLAARTASSSFFLCSCVVPWSAQITLIIIPRTSSLIGFPSHVDANPHCVPIPSLRYTPSVMSLRAGTPTHCFSASSFVLL